MSFLSVDICQQSLYSIATSRVKQTRQMMASDETELPYQQRGSDFLAARPKAILADEMGLGKTFQAIRAADKAAVKTVLWLGPATSLHTIAREFERWQSVERTVGVVSGTVPTTDVLICSYDRISRGGNRVIGDRRFDLLVCDEAHALKTPTSKRTKYILGRGCSGRGGLVERANRTWFLTGTPVPNHYGEIWPMLRAAFPDRITRDGASGPDTHWQFIGRYCVTADTPFGIQIKGSKNHAALKETLRGVMLRRRKEKVLAELPPLTFGTVTLNPEKAERDLLRRAEGDVPSDVLDILRAAHATHRRSEASDDAIAAALAAEMTQLATLRRLTGIAKAYATSRLLDEELSSGTLGKVIVFAYHTDAVDHLREALLAFNPVVVDGRTPDRQRQQAVDTFQSVSQCRVFIGQIVAAGTAITLTAASNVVFAEADWVPANNVQAAARAHRIGQSLPVLARFVTLAGSLDEKIMGTLSRKTRDIAQLLD